MADPTLCTPLAHEGILATRGPDAAKFLQGQLACNLAYLNNETPSLGGHRNIKGRLLSNFRILPGGNGLPLAMAGELLEAQLTDLKRYAVLSKASLADESVAWFRTGLRDASEALRALGIDTPVESGKIARHGDSLAVALDDVRAELWVPVQRAETVPATLREYSREASLDDWLLDQMYIDVGQVFGATRELFIPQMINLQAVGGVSFKKGYYTGQEIVAHTQYFGHLRRRLYRLTLDTDEVPAPSTGLFPSVHSTSVSKVALAVRTPENSVELLAVLQDDVIVDDRINLGSTKGAPLVPPNLPYTLDGNREIQRRP